MKIVIDKHVPLPKGHASTQGRMAQLREVYGRMAPGHSFVYDHANVTHAYLAAKQLGVKITSRKLEKGGFRVWRKS